MSYFTAGLKGKKKKWHQAARNIGAGRRALPRRGNGEAAAPRPLSLPYLPSARLARRRLKLSAPCVGISCATTAFSANLSGSICVSLKRRRTSPVCSGSAISAHGRRENLAAWPVRHLVEGSEGDAQAGVAEEEEEQGAASSACRYSALSGLCVWQKATRRSPACGGSARRRVAGTVTSCAAAALHGARKANMAARLAHAWRVPVFSALLYLNGRIGKYRN